MVQYYPIHITHIVVSLIWASALIGLNAIEFIYSHISGMSLFWIVIQNSVIGIGSAYWLIKTHITPEGTTIQSTASKQ